MARAPRRRQADAAASTAESTSAPPTIEIPVATKPAVRLHLRLAKCRNLLMRGARQSVERWGLTLPQFDVLAELSRAKAEGFTFVELSRLLLVTSGNLTGIVDRLEAEGLVRRETDARDRRLVRIVLTKKGRRLAEEIMPLHAQDIHALLAFMPPEQLTALTDMLNRVRDGLRAQLTEEGEAASAGRPAARAGAASARTRGGRPMASRRGYRFAADEGRESTSTTLTSHD